MKRSTITRGLLMSILLGLAWNVQAQDQSKPSGNEGAESSETTPNEKKSEDDQYYETEPEKFTYSVAGNINYNDVVQDLNNQNIKGEFDFYQFIAKSNYAFSKKWSLTSKVVVLHLLDPEYNNGDVLVQDLYMKYKHSKKFAIQSGVVSLPINGGIYGIYGSVMLAPVEKYLAYSWREAGIGISGRFKNNVSYRATLTTGLDPAELHSKSGILSARTHKFFESTKNVATAIQLVYDNKYDIRFGFSALYSGLNNSGVTSATFSGANYQFAEVFSAYKFGYVGTRAVASFSTIQGVDAINDVFQNKAGSAQAGILLEASYDFSRFLNDETQKLHTFLRSEYYDTQYRTSGDVTDDSKYEHYDYTIGMVYQPTDFLELKADYQLLRFGGKYSSQLFDLSIGFKF